MKAAWESVKWKWTEEKDEINKAECYTEAGLT